MEARSSTDALRVVIADDHALLLDALRAVLDDDPGMEVVGEARNGDDVLPVVAREQPDALLLDLRMPGMGGLEVLALVRQQHPDVTVILLSGVTDQSTIAEALNGGASAYIVKTVNPTDIPSLVRHAVHGGVHFPGQFSPEPVSEETTRLKELTEREREILRAVAEGMSTKAISRDQWVTEKTVKFHLTNIYRKLGVSNRTGAARFAYEQGLLDDRGF